MTFKSRIPTPVILDCDPGQDDAVAILLALASPAVALLGITTVSGNCPLEQATRNALDVLYLLGREDVPVIPGAARSLEGRPIPDDYRQFQPGLGGVPLLRSPSRPLNDEATTWMTRIIAESKHPVTLIVTGPATNIAHLLRSHPEVVDGIAEIILMAGSTGRGNVTPYAEFNAFVDPEALAIVLASPVPCRMVGLNLTRQALVNADIIHDMQAIIGGLGSVVAGWMGFLQGKHGAAWSFDAAPVHDPCTVAGLVDPPLITWTTAFVGVETEGRWTRGATAIDLEKRWQRQHDATAIGMALDAPRYWQLVLDSIERLAIDTTGLDRVPEQLDHFI